MTDHTHPRTAAGSPVEFPVRPLPQRWTGIVQAHCSGGFVAVGDYMAAMDEIERLRAELAEVNTDRERWIRRADKTWNEVQAVAAERERIAKHFDDRDKGTGGFYEPHEPAEIIRALKA